MSNRLNDANAWPAPIQEGVPLKNIASHCNPGPLLHHCYPQELINYILYVCKKKQLSPRSFEATLIICTRYLKLTNRLESVQLICLVSLMLASKLYDYYSLTMGQIHEVSNHQFTNKQICQIEAKILMTLDFNLFNENKKSEHEKNVIQRPLVHYSIYEMLIIVIEMTQGLIPKQKLSFYYEQVNKIFYLYLHMFYTKEFKSKVVQKLSNPKLIICIIIKIALMSLTQTNGIFPQIQWIQQIFKMKENQNEKKFDDQFEQIVAKILPIMLGNKSQNVKNEMKSFYIRN